jgi:glutathione S-transferase
MRACNFPMRGGHTRKPSRDTGLSVRRGVCWLMLVLSGAVRARVTTPEERERSRERAALCDGLLAWTRASSEVIASSLGDDGPFFLGSCFSAADVALSPWWPQR